jgi:hypothetical protein
MKEWLEEVNNGIREALPIMMVVTWLLAVALLLRGLYTGAIR